MAGAAHLLKDNAGVLRKLAKTFTILLSRGSSHSLSFFPYRQYSFTKEAPKFGDQVLSGLMPEETYQAACPARDICNSANPGGQAVQAPGSQLFQPWSRHPALPVRQLLWQLTSASHPIQQSAGNPSVVFTAGLGFSDVVVCLIHRIPIASTSSCI